MNVKCFVWLYKLYIKQNPLINPTSIYTLFSNLNAHIDEKKERRELETFIILI